MSAPVEDFTGLHISDDPIDLVIGTAIVLNGEENEVPVEVLASDEMPEAVSVLAEEVVDQLDSVQDTHGERSPEALTTSYLIKMIATNAY